MSITENSAGARSDLKEILERHLAQWPAAGAISALTANGVRVSAGDLTVVFPWASVTKMVVSLATLIAVEETVLSLDDEAGPPGATVRHLLSHSSGLPFEGRAPVARPGRRRVYSNTGIEMAAEYLASKAGMPFVQYATEGVLRPLGMTSASISGSPASGGRGTIADLDALAAEMLQPSLLSTATWREATSVAFPGLVGVVPGFGRQDPCDWGLGPELRGHKSPHWTGTANSPSTFGHFGMSGSFVWVDPAIGVALCGLCSEDFDLWAKKSWPRLSDDVVKWANAGS